MSTERLTNRHLRFYSSKKSTCIIYSISHQGASAVSHFIRAAKFSRIELGTWIGNLASSDLSSSIILYQQQQFYLKLTVAHQFFVSWSPLSLDLFYIPIMKTMEIILIRKRWSIKSFFCFNVFILRNKK